MSLFALMWTLASQPASVPAHPIAPGDQMDPTATITFDGLVVAYVDRQPGGSQVMYVQTPDLDVYSAPIPLGPKTGLETIRPHAASDFFTTTVVVWSDASGGDHDVYCATSIDGGFTFSEPVLAAGGPGGQVDPRAAVLDDGTIVITFQDSAGSTGEDRGVRWKVRWVTSTDGLTFTPAAEIPGQSVDQFHLFPAISSSGQAVMVAWLGDGIMTALSTDGGVTFSDAVRVDGGTPGPLLAPRITRTTLGWLVAYGAVVSAGQQRPLENDPGDARYLEIYGTTSTGAAFLAPTIITMDRTLNQMNVDLHELEGVLAMSWVDHTTPGVRKIRIQLSYDAGGSFDLFEPISDNPDDVEVGQPAVTSLGDLVTVTWQDARGGTWDVRTVVVGR